MNVFPSRFKDWFYLGVRSTSTRIVLEVEEVRIGGPARMEASFTEFYADLKATEKKDSTLTPKQQIDRLLKPGSSYR